MVALGLFAGATAIAVYASQLRSSPAGATAVSLCFLFFFARLLGYYCAASSPSLGLWLLHDDCGHCSGGVDHGGVLCAQVVHEGEVRRHSEVR